MVLNCISGGREGVVGRSMCKGIGAIEFEFRARGTGSRFDLGERGRLIS